MISEVQSLIFKKINLIFLDKQTKYKYKYVWAIVQNSSSGVFISKIALEGENHINNIH